MTTLKVAVLRIAFLLNVLTLTCLSHYRSKLKEIAICKIKIVIQSTCPKTSIFKNLLLLNSQLNAYLPRCCIAV